MTDNNVKYEEVKILEAYTILSIFLGDFFFSQFHLPAETNRECSSRYLNAFLSCRLRQAQSRSGSFRSSAGASDQYVKICNAVL
jgi:hypothetical protein